VVWSFRPGVSDPLELRKSMGVAAVAVEAKYLFKAELFFLY
jgi:hypothetical protein